eukprot:4955484-Prorocentrum_lima.AAC.1
MARGICHSVSESSCGCGQEHSSPGTENAYRSATTRAVFSHSYASSGASPCIHTAATCCSRPRK